MEKKLLKYLLLITTGLFFLAGPGCAETKEVRTEEAEPKKYLQAIEFLTGFSRGQLDKKGAYVTSPFMVNLDFDLKPLTQKIGLNSWGLLQFQLEPFIAPIYQPEANVEIGNGFIFKIGILPDTSKLQPYLKGGAGIAYMTQHTLEQSTQFNFFEYGGAGLHYFFTKNTALTVEGRYRHLSNASIKYPNRGIENYFALVGVAYQF